MRSEADWAALVARVELAEGLSREAERQRDEARADADRWRPTTLHVSAREHARRRGALNGADAQALEHALTMTERERDEARAEVERLRADDAGLREALALANATSVERQREVERLRAEVAAAREAGVRAGPEAAAARLHERPDMALTCTACREYGHTTPCVGCVERVEGADRCATGPQVPELPATCGACEHARPKMGLRGSGLVLCSQRGDGAEWPAVRGAKPPPASCPLMRCQTGPQAGSQHHWLPEGHCMRCGVTR